MEGGRCICVTTSAPSNIGKLQSPLLSTTLQHHTHRPCTSNIKCCPLQHCCKPIQHPVILFSCHFCREWFSVLLLLSGMLVCFAVLLTISERFFCPALELISEYLQLPPVVAGATLLSFGNGAPDIFTQVAAVGQVCNRRHVTHAAACAAQQQTSMAPCRLSAASQPAVVLQYYYRLIQEP